MRTKLRSKFTLLFIVCAALLAFAGTAMALTADPSGDTSPAPTIQSDQADYPPGATVTLTGSNWQAGESVHINVNDDQGQTWSRNVDVTADASGQVQDQFQLPDWFVATYNVTATGAQSGVVTTSFTDGNVEVRSNLPNAADGWQLTETVYTTSTACSGTIKNGFPTTKTMTGGTGGSSKDTVGVGSSESVKLQASSPSLPSGQVFINWSGPATFTDLGSRTICVQGFQSGGKDYVANYGRATTTSVTRTAGSNPSTYGDNVTFQAAVTAPGGDPNSVGTVTFKDGANTISGCSAVSLSGNTATCTTSKLSAGSHNITAEYSGTTTGSPLFSPSTSSELPHTVDKKALTVSGITAANEVYDGNTSATLDTTNASLNGVVSGDTVTLDKSGTSGSFANKNVGTGKTVTISGLSISGASASNYTLTQPTATADITARPLAVSASGVNKVYDGTTSATVTLSDNRVSGDVLNTSYTSASFDNKNVGTGKAVSVTGISISGTDAGNYTANTTASTTANITARPITVSADPQTKVYGANDPNLTYQVTSGSLATGDSFSGSLTRDLGESVAGSPYAIKQGTLSAGSNYTLTFNGANLTITARPITVTADAKTKVYGESDPNLTYQVTSGSLATGDSFNGSLTRDLGESVAGSPYAIKQGSLSAGSNYNLTFNGANLTITARPITVSADPQTKVYGANDPNLTYQVTSGSLATGDSFSGNLTRDLGESVAGSPYAIKQGTLSAGSNYTLTFNGANLTITARPITVSADPQTKVYGANDPNLTYQVTSGSLVTGDSFSGSLTRDPGESVAGSPYAIKQGSLSAGNNYNLTFNGANLTITPKSLTGSFTADNKIYDGTVAATILTRTLNEGGVLDSDDVQLSGGTAKFNNANVGQDKPVAGTDFTLTGDQAGNYTLASSTLATTADITERPIEVTADAKTKAYGNADPALTYQVTSGSLATGDSFNGSLTRDTGENVGTYAIKQGTLSAGSNYTLTFNGANLTITARPITVTADAKTKLLGALDPPLTYQITAGNLVNGDSFTGSLKRDPGETVGTYAIKQDTLSAGGNYAITYIGANLKIVVNYSGFLQPINDTAHQTGLFQSKFKLGQTIPVKFELRDYAGNLVQQATNPTFSKVYRGACDSTTALEAPVAVTPDAGTQYIYTGGQYHYNWSTKGLQAGEWRIYANLANLADGTINYVDICLTK
jgi:hypothetical protein